MFATHNTVHLRSNVQRKAVGGADENARSNMVQTRTKTIKEVGQATTVVTRKRAALGDVSNVQTAKVVPAGKDVAKVRTARTQGVAVAKPKTKKAVENTVKSSVTGGVTTKTVSTKVRSQPTVAKSDSSNVDPSVENVESKKEVVKKGIKASAQSAKTKSSKESDEVKVVATRRVKTNVHQTVHEEDVESKQPVHKKAKTQADVQWDDLDAEDMLDPVMMSEYVNEIFEYMRELEIQTMPDPNYMDGQKELQWKMRCILVDWLIEVHCKFRLLPETLYLGINLIDRFLSQRTVSLVKLQLVGVTAMFVAAKYEEVIAPTIQNFLYMADGGYTEEEIQKAERYLLQTLEFELQYPSPMSFLRRCSKADQYDIQTRTLAKYLMEISLIDHRFLKFPPSMIAASGLYLARHMLDRGEWNGNLTHYSGYTEEELLECCDTTLDFLSRPIKYEAIFKKYSNRKFMKAAIFVKDWMEKQGADYRLAPIINPQKKAESEVQTESKKTASTATVELIDSSESSQPDIPEEEVSSDLDA